MPCTPFDIDIEVVTPDGLRKIVFGLQRTCNADGTEKWTIHFELDETANSGGVFTEVVKLDVEVDPQMNAKAAATAQSGGLDANQTAQAMVAADTAKAYTQGSASKEDAASDAHDVIAARA